MKSVLKAVMSHPLLTARPPVFLDVGASGALPAEWKLLAPYSICIAFDADTRDFQITQSEARDWKRLYSLNRLVSPNVKGEVLFYLTKSPHCSSSLQPDKTSLARWAFSPLFDVVKQVTLPAVDLQKTLVEIGIDYIDWYKADTQGTDLRIFSALDEQIRDRILVADFEPGIIDAYLTEDKLHHVMAYMDERRFWVSRMNLLGSQRIDQDSLTSLSSEEKRGLAYRLKSAPGWCEISYLNSLENGGLGCREYLLAWIFSSMKGEHGFALHVAQSGIETFKDPLFDELRAHSRKSLSRSIVRYTANLASKVAARVISAISELK